MPSTTTSRLEGLTASVAVKAPCRLKTSANHPLAGLAAIDDVVPAEHDRVLVAANADATENGIWIAQVGMWARAADFDGALDVVCGTTVFVHSGTTNGGTFWRVTTPDEIVIGVSAIAWASAPVVNVATNGIVPVSSFRQLADSTDEPALQAAQAYVEANPSLRGVQFDGAVTTLKPAMVTPPFTDWAVAANWPVNLLPGCRIDSRGTVIAGAEGGGWGERSTLYAYCDLRGRHTINAAIAAGSKVIPVASTAGAAVGDEVLLRMGDIPFDTPEPRNFHFSRIESIQAGVSITLEDPISEEFTAAQLTAATLNKYLWRVRWLRDELDSDFVFAKGTEVGLSITGLVGGKVGSITGPCPDQCALVLQYVKGLRVGTVSVWDNEAAGANKGKAGRCAETRDTVFENWVTSNLRDNSFAAEASSRVHFKHLSDHNSFAGTRTVLIANGNSHIRVDELVVTGLGGQLIFDTPDAPTSTIYARRLVVNTSAPPAFMGKIGLNFDEIDYTINGVREWYHRDDADWVEYTFNLINGQASAVWIGLPNTIVGNVELITTSGIIAGVNAAVVRESFTSNLDLTAIGEVEPSKAKMISAGSIDAASGSVNGPARKTEGLLMYVSAAPQGGAVPNLAGQQVTLRVQIIRDRVAWQDLGSVGTGITITDTQARGVAEEFELDKGPSANRPLGVRTGTMYLDTTLDTDGKPIWWNGSNWVDATGAVV